LDLQADKLEDAGQVDVVFDVIGGEILDRSPKRLLRSLPAGAPPGRRSSGSPKADSRLRAGQAR
jgi:hypothetical protein